MSKEVIIGDEVYYDPDEKEIESLEYVFELCTLHEVWDGYPIWFWNRVCRKEIGEPFNREKFLHNDDIIATLTGFGLDAEKFWWAVLFIFDWTMTKFYNCLAPKTPLDSLQEICDYIGNGDKLSVAFRVKGRKGKDADHNIRKILVESLHRELKRLQKTPPHYVVVLDSERFTTSYDNILCYQICFAAERFKDLFTALRLPSKIKTQAGSSVREVSYNKQLLISRLLYLMKLASNENFKYSDESLKGILKSYKDKIPQTHSAIYI